MTGFADTDRLGAVALAADAPRRTPEMAQEVDVAIFDLVEDNRFRIATGTPPAGPYRLVVGMAERMLTLSLSVAETGAEAGSLHLSLSPLRGILRDYFAVCDSYYDAVRRLPPSKIEAIDMGRRGLHNDGAEILLDRLSGKIDTDIATARRLFTLIAALQERGPR